MLIAVKEARDNAFKKYGFNIKAKATF